MRFWLGLCLASLLWAAPAVADSVDIQWDSAQGATSYEVHRATALAGPWTVLATVAAGTACTGTPVICTYTDANAPATGGAYYRLAPKNASGILPMTRMGVWYCGDCPGLPSPPPRMGIVW